MNITALLQGERVSQSTKQTDRRQQRQALSKGSPRKTEEKRKHLDTLGLSDPAHLLEVQQAYGSMARTYHPDRYAAAAYSRAERDAAASRLQRVMEAYDWLCANA